MSGAGRPGQVRAAALHHPARPPDRRYPDAAVRMLACPHCGSPLAPGSGSFSCSNGHSFDIARQGYIALLGPRSRTDTADSGDMVGARAEFLAAGHYRPIASAVARSVAGRHGRLLDIGAGTGYYLSSALDTAGTDAAGIALDSSKYAARRAASDSRVVSVVADAWSPLPLQGGSAAAVLSVFAPRNPSEIRRVLAPDGLLVAVTSQAHHLVELRNRLPMLTVDAGKAAKLAESFGGIMSRVHTEPVEFGMALGRPDISALLRMGPSSRHVEPDALATRIAELPPRVTVTAAVTVTTLAVVSELGGTAARHRG